MRKQEAIRLSDAKFKPGTEIDASVRSLLRKTYGLLSLTLLFSAVCAFYSLDAAPINFIIQFVGVIGLSALTMRLCHSRYGIISLFAFTGFTGYTVGPALNFYLTNFSNGPQLVGTSLAATGLIFVTLSAYTIISRKNFTYMGGVLAIGVIVAFLGIIANHFLQISGFALLLSGAIAVISAGYILFMTSAIINKGETNTIVTTITLYIAIFNLFVSLLRILSMFAGGNSSK